MKFIDKLRELMGVTHRIAGSSRYEYMPSPKGEGRILRIPRPNIYVRTEGAAEIDRLMLAAAEAKRERRRAKNLGRA